jgi:hypothetical protein
LHYYALLSSAGCIEWRPTCTGIMTNDEVSRNGNKPLEKYFKLLLLLLLLLLLTNSPYKWKTLSK